MNPISIIAPLLNEWQLSGDGSIVWYDVRGRSIDLQIALGAAPVVEFPEVNAVRL